MNKAKQQLESFFGHDCSCVCHVALGYNFNKCPHCTPVEEAKKEHNCDCHDNNWGMCNGLCLICNPKPTNQEEHANCTEAHWPTHGKFWPTKQEEWQDRFIKEFCNDHNGEIRFLRGIFYDEKDGAEEIMQYIQQELDRVKEEEYQRGLQDGMESNEYAGIMTGEISNAAKQQLREELIAEIKITRPSENLLWKREVIDLIKSKK